MATSAIQICSNALLLLGDSPISNFSEDSDRARLASNLWANARQSVLRVHPWNCAKEMVALAPEVTAPAFDWSFKFQLPADCLRILFVGESGVAEDYAVLGRSVLSDANPLYLTYIFDETNVANWDAMLVEAMQRYMAFSMAYALTKSATLRDSLHEEYLRLLQQAKSIDGQEEPPDTAGDFPLLNARR